MDELAFKDTYQDAQLYFSKKQYRKALEALKKAHCINPEHFEMNLLIGKIFYKLKEYLRAKKIFSELNEKQPNNELVKLFLAYTYYYTGKKAGDVTIAENITDEIVKKNNKNIYALELKADIHLTNKEFEEALELYKTIKTGTDNIHRLVFKEAICFYYLKNYAESLKLCSQLFEAGYNKHREVKQLYEASKKRRKSIFLKAFGQITWAQRVFAFFFDPYMDKTLSLQAEADRRVDYTKRKLYTDKLTQINNRTCFDEKIKPRFTNGEIISLMMFDIDKFKTINDTYGHDTGDIVLKKFAEIGREVIGGNFFRYGGEEFFAIQTNDSKEAFFTAEKFRKIIEKELAEHTNKEKGTMIQSITCSGGIAEYPREGADFDTVYKLVDQRLYTSKETGRNKNTVGNKE